MADAWPRDRDREVASVAAKRAFLPAGIRKNNRPSNPIARFELIARSIA
jgi:hypothetical protein